jgi:hypothetical protein
LLTGAQSTLPKGSHAPEGPAPDETAGSSFSHSLSCLSASLSLSLIHRFLLAELGLRNCHMRNLQDLTTYLHD